jgi:hypothetical protein
MSPTAAKIFFSYARSDGAFVLRVARALRSEGCSVWVDQLDIPKGARWDVEVETALKACTCLVAVISPASVASSNVMDEISYALDEKKTVLPILFQQCAIPFRLKRLQYVDFTGDHEAAMRELLAALPLVEAAAAPVSPSPSPSPSPAPPPREPRQPQPGAIAGLATPPPASLKGRRLLKPLAIGASTVVLVVAVYGVLSQRPSVPAIDEDLPPAAAGNPSPASDAVARPPEPTVAAARTALPAATAVTSPPPPAPAAGLPDDRLRDFVDRYLAAQSRASAADLLPFYADRVDFYDQRGVGHDSILKDKSAYYKRWPDVQMQLAGSVQIDRSTGKDSYALAYPVRYAVKSAARADGRSGMAREELVVREIDGRLLIVAQRERILASQTLDAK